MDSIYKDYFLNPTATELKTPIEFIFIISLVLRIIRPEGYSIVGTSLETCASEVLKVKFIPYSKEATNEEKAVIAKMSDKSYAFVEKSLEGSIHHPMLVPSFVDMEEYQEQVTHMEQLRTIEAHIRELNKAAHDTLMLVSSEVYQTSLIFYNNVKSAAKNNIPGAQSIYEELKGRFESQGQRGPKKEDSKVE